MGKLLKRKSYGNGKVMEMEKYDIGKVIKMDKLRKQKSFEKIKDL